MGRAYTQDGGASKKRTRTETRCASRPVSTWWNSPGSVADAAMVVADWPARDPQATHGSCHLICGVELLELDCPAGLFDL